MSNGGGGRDRTDDLRLAKPSLSQLSYAPILIARTICSRHTNPPYRAEDLRDAARRQPTILDPERDAPAASKVLRREQCPLASLERR